MLVIVAALRKAAVLPIPFDQNPEMGSIQNLGFVLLNDYMFPFEFASILFLSAMIGAVLLAKKDI